MKKCTLSIFLITFLFSHAIETHAQSGNPYVNAGNDVTLNCNDSCTTLHATYQSAGSTNAYTVTAIPYTPFPYNAGSPIIIGIDDKWSQVIPLPFPFCFFGNTYTNVVVGSNGILTFDVAAANGFCNWSLTSGATLPTPTFGIGSTNAIMGAYMDIDPTFMGVISWYIAGPYPFRALNVSFYQVPYFGDPNSVSNCCCTPMFATNQIILHETTNIIDIYIQDKPVCTGWNGGRAIEGIQNANATVAYTVPGRNNAVWAVTNDAWRFTPSGTNSAVNLAWFENSVQVGTGDSVTVCPDSTTAYIVRATYSTCFATPVQLWDTVTVFVANSLLMNTAATAETCTGCDDGTIAVNVSSGNPPYQYSISPAAGNLSGNTFINLPAGDYLICVTDSAGCFMCDSVRVDFPAGIEGAESNNSMYISSNPFHSTATLYIGNVSAKAELKIYNVLGEEVKRQMITDKTTAINRDGMADGIYFMKVRNGSHESVQKLVVE